MKRKKENEADRRRGGKTISKSGQNRTASSTRAAENRITWKGIVANLSVVPRRSSAVRGIE